MCDNPPVSVGDDRQVSEIGQVSFYVHFNQEPPVCVWEALLRGFVQLVGPNEIEWSVKGSIYHVIVRSEIYSSADLRQVIDLCFPKVVFNKVAEKIRDIGVIPRACYIPLRMLDISIRLQNISLFANMAYVGDWACLDLNKPVKIRAFGAICKNEVKSMLERFQLSCFYMQCNANEQLWPRRRNNMIAVQHETETEKLSKQYFPDDKAVKAWLEESGGRQ